MSRSFATPWAEACQAPLSMGFPRWKHWSELPFPYNLYTDLEQGLSLSKGGVMLDGISLFLGTRPTMFSSPQDSILFALRGHCVLGLSALYLLFFFFNWRVDTAGEEEGKTNWESSIERYTLPYALYPLKPVSCHIKQGLHPQIHAMLNVLPYEGHLCSSGRQSLRYKDWTSRRNS